jgi:uncharacterized membrane protein YphA (DoxX/SURF4 family)
MGTVLWIVQGLIGFAFFMGGTMKILKGHGAMGNDPDNWTRKLPLPFVRFIGVAEVTGALGVVLPRALDTAVGLTPFASLGLLVIMIGAAQFHIRNREPGMAAVTGVLGLFNAFILYRFWA